MPEPARTSRRRIAWRPRRGDRRRRRSRPRSRSRPAGAARRATPAPTFHRINVDTADQRRELHLGRRGLRRRAEHRDQRVRRAGRRGPPDRRRHPAGLPASARTCRLDARSPSSMPRREASSSPTPPTIDDVDGDGDSDIIVPVRLLLRHRPRRPADSHRRHHLVGEHGRRYGVRAPRRGHGTGRAPTTASSSSTSTATAIKDLVSVERGGQGRRRPDRRRWSRPQFFKGDGRRQRSQPAGRARRRRRQPAGRGTTSTATATSTSSPSQYFDAVRGPRRRAGRRPSCGSRTPTPTTSP